MHALALYVNTRIITMSAQLTNIIMWLFIGLVAGCLAGLLMKNKKSSLLTNMIVGVIGSFVGGYGASLLNIRAGGIIGSIVIATAGACLLIFLIRMLR